eukprot:jgi/Chrpa1/4756/Chrysochromulina_OHIO_Genome00019324-RA
MVTWMIATSGMIAPAALASSSFPAALVASTVAAATSATTSEPSTISAASLAATAVAAKPTCRLCPSTDPPSDPSSVM